MTEKPHMTHESLHDVLLAAATALPVLYVPVALILLDRRDRFDKPLITARGIYAYLVVFVNAEVSALFDLGRAGGSEHQPGLDWLDLWTLTFTGLATVVGILFAFGPVLAELVPTAADGHSSLRNWLWNFALMLPVLPLPAAIAARAVDAGSLPLELALAAGVTLATALGSWFIETKRRGHGPHLPVSPGRGAALDAPASPCVDDAPDEPSRAGG